MKQLYATLALDLRENLSNGKHCSNCDNYARCSNTGKRVSPSQTFCKYNPSRFKDKRITIQMNGEEEGECIVLKMC